VGATRAVVMLEPPPFERLTDREWKRIGPMVEATRGTCGGPRTDLRLAVDAIRWVLHNGAKWREMPKDLGSPTTCWRWYERWCSNGTWAKVTAAMELPATETGREPRHAPRSATGPKPTIEVAAVEVGPPPARRGRLAALRRSA
jgi:hypothetical protein